MKKVIRFECPYCKKIFKTPNRHFCRRDPRFRNCYSCKHWGHQFVVTGSDGWANCPPEKACKINGACAYSAFPLMHENGWYLDCPDWEPEDKP